MSVGILRKLKSVSKNVRLEIQGNAESGGIYARKICCVTTRILGFSDGGMGVAEYMPGIE